MEASYIDAFSGSPIIYREGLWSTEKKTQPRRKLRLIYLRLWSVRVGVRVMRDQRGKNTPAAFPNSTVLSCHLCLVYRPSKSEEVNVPLDGILLHDSGASTPTVSMSRFPGIQDLWYSRRVHAHKMTKPLQSAISDDISQVRLFGQRSYILVCFVLGPSNTPDLPLTPHIKCNEPGFVPLC